MGGVELFLGDGVRPVARVVKLVLRRGAPAVS